MVPTGIEPVSNAPEAFVVSILLRDHIILWLRYRIAKINKGEAARQSFAYNPPKIVQAKAAFNKGANEMRYFPNKAAPDALIQRVFSPCNAYQYPGYSVSVIAS